MNFGYLDSVEIHISYKYLYACQITPKHHLLQSNTDVQEFIIHRMTNVTYHV